jgi:uncharacterized protein (DUF2235 family)
MLTNTGHKNIVLCSDGTGNQDIKARGTNVFKIYEAVDIQGYKTNPEIPHQVAFYDDGLGTSKLLPLKIIGGAFGWGFSENIRTLYMELVEVYRPGDNIYLFGFSRGAYTIRALSAMIYYCGILDRENWEHAAKLDGQVEICFKEFKKATFGSPPKGIERRAYIRDSEDSALEEGRRAGFGAIIDKEHVPNGVPPIKFLGVWDTVGAVGVPFGKLQDWFDFWFKIRFSDLTMAANVGRGCHAISIDDERRTFYPQLWNEKDGKDDRIKQVWFSGVHSNVGGGYTKQGMSLVALDWMMAEAEAAGLYFIPSDREYVRSHQDVHGDLVDSRAGIHAYYRWAPRNIARICKEHRMLLPKIHVSVFERVANGTDCYAPGNIPFECEIVRTVCEKPQNINKPKDAQSLNNPKDAWPPDETLKQIKETFGKKPEDALKDASSLLATMDRDIWWGKRSYTAFIVLVLVTACLAIMYFRHLHILAIILSAFAALAWGIWYWACCVGEKLDSKYSEFWAKHRSKLSESLAGNKSRSA